MPRMTSAALAAVLLLTVIGHADWLQRANLPSGIEGHATAYDPAGDRIYTFCGTPTGGGGPWLNYVFQYNPSADTWAVRTPAPIALAYIDASYVRGKFYCFGGYDGTIRDYNMIYDVAGNSWSNGASLPAARYVAGQVPYNDSLVYMLGGMRLSNAASNTVFIYNTYTGAWTTGTPLLTNFGIGGVAITGDTIWLIGGYDGPELLHYLYYGVINPANCEQIAWHQGTALLHDHWYHGSTMLKRGNQWYLYLVAGWHDIIIPTDEVYEYSVSAGTWTMLPNYPFKVLKTDICVGREGHDEIYVCGGDYEDTWVATDSVYMLNVATGVGESGGRGESFFDLGFASSMPAVSNGPTRISYVTPARSMVTIRVYDTYGRLVATVVDRELQPAGLKNAFWNGRDSRRNHVAGGIYFVRLEASGKTADRKLTVVR